MIKVMLSKIETLMRKINSYTSISLRITTNYRFSKWINIFFWKKGPAGLILITLLIGFNSLKGNDCIKAHGAIIRGDTSRKELTLVFTGGKYGEGGNYITGILDKYNIKAAFFFTGNFYRDSSNFELIKKLKERGHYLGPHSDQHLLYCSWERRDSLLVSKQQFQKDILDNYRIMDKFGISKEDAKYFIPPYEWYNRTIVKWASELDLELINFSPGTLSNADYTNPDMENYRSSEEIYQSILSLGDQSSAGLNGFILLSHIGASPKRQDKFYYFLDKLIPALSNRGYNFLPIDDLLEKCK